MNATIQHHKKTLVTAGLPLEKGNPLLIMIHGRGGSAEEILGLAGHLDVKNFSLVAPQATGHTWYPYSFMAPTAENEPWLSSALGLLQSIVADAKAAGVEEKDIYFLGFSQGACLTLEYVARNAARYGGVVAFTGGLIGQQIDTTLYKGDFSGTPVFIGSSHPDPHVPAERVHHTAVIMKGMGATLTEKIYNGMGHTINGDEIEHANRLVFSKR